MIIVWVMYGLKSEGIAWRTILAIVMKNGFQVLFSI